MRHIIGICVLSAWALQTAQAQNWPQWRGPNGDSVSKETGLPINWGENSNLLWKTQLPPWGNSTPVIWGDAIFLTSHQDDKLLVLKINKTNGKIEWTHEVGQGTAKREGDKREQKFHKLHNLASPSAVTDGNKVVFHFGSGNLLAFDFAGNQLWKRNLAEDYGAYTIWWGHANSPVLHENLVISVCMQDSLNGVREKLAPSYLVAHNLENGLEMWKSMRMTGAEAEQCDSYTTPVFHGSGDARQMLVMGGNQLDAYNPKTGQQIWSLPGLIGGRTITGPTVWQNMVLLTQGQRGPLQAVRLGGQGELDKNKVVAWKDDQGTPDSCCPVVWEDLVFTVADNGIASCYDVRNGQRKWRERLKGDFKASPVAIGGRIYFLNTQGMCTVVSASPRFDKLTENQLNDETLASPSVSDRRLYIRGKNALYCIGKP